MRTLGIEWTLLPLHMLLPIETAGVMEEGSWVLCIIVDGAVSLVEENNESGFVQRIHSVFPRKAVNSP